VVSNIKEEKEEKKMLKFFEGKRTYLSDLHWSMKSRARSTWNIRRSSSENFRCFSARHLINERCMRRKLHIERIKLDENSPEEDEETKGQKLINKWRTTKAEVVK
jgi:hypothetical protein